MEEQTKKYYQAWWDCEALDKVPLKILAPKDIKQTPMVYDKTPQDNLDKEKVVELAQTNILNTFYGGVALPCYLPAFGPDVFSACLGAKLKFAPLGSYPVSWADWNKPVLKDYSDLSILQIRDDNLYFQKIKEFTAYALERSAGKYIVGIPDLHASIDSLAVLRGGPENFLIDLCDNPDGVKEAMKLLWRAWLKIYGESYQLIKKKQHGTDSWINLWAPGKMYNVQNDFSCLISTKMYEDFFLEELLNEINYLDYSIYHLDGPDALKHLDMLLDIKKLNAVQWVPGAGKEGLEKWMPVYKKIQSRNKSIIVYCKPDEIDLVLNNLSPKGLLIETWCSSEKEAKELLDSYNWGL